MQKVLAGFCDQSYTSRSKWANAERAINLYIETDETGQGKGIKYLYSTPGLGSAIDLTKINDGQFANAKILGMTITSSNIQGGANRCFIVAGIVGGNAWLLELLANNNGINYKTSWQLMYTDSDAPNIKPIVVNANDYAVMQDNGFDLFIALGKYGNVLSLIDKQPGTPNSRPTDTLTPLAKVGTGNNLLFEGCQAIAFLNGRLIAVIQQGTNKGYNFIWSDQYNALSWPALNFASAESDTDNTISILSTKTAIFLFGTRTIEVWNDTGQAAPNPPLLRQAGNVVHYGAVSPRGNVISNNSIYFLSQDVKGSVFVMVMDGSGGTQRVSNYAVEYYLTKLGARVQECVAYVYTEAGHEFIVFNFPPMNDPAIEDRTWVYDVREGVWHERQSYRRENEITDGQAFTRHRGQFHGFFNFNHVLTDYLVPTIYLSSLNYSDDNGDPILRVRTSPHSFDKLNRVRYDAFQLDIEVGKGITPVANQNVNDDSQSYVQGVDNSVVLEYSSDGGHTWSNAGKKEFTQVGNYVKRLLWYRLGIARDRVFRVSITANSQIAIVNAYINYEVCRN